MKLWRVPTVLAPLVAHTAYPQICSLSYQNVLTSDCPTECGNKPCVLYSPNHNEKCYPYAASGACLELPGTTAECNGTYQCLQTIVNKDTKAWQLALLPSKLSETTLTTAAVTQIKNLKYEDNTTLVEVIGGLGRNVRGDLKNVDLDASFFNTTEGIISFYLSDINVRSFLNKIDFTKVKWTKLAFRNANLDAVPAGLSSLALYFVDLSKNYITTINDSKPFLKADTVNLNDNSITEFSIDLPDVTALNLSGNPLGKIPDSIYGMSKLKTLSMINCNLTNLQLTEEQFAFLEKRAVFEANPVVVNCSTGFIRKNLGSVSGSVCVQQVVRDALVIDQENEDTGGGARITIGVASGLGVLVALVVVALIRQYSTHDDAVTTPAESGTLADDGDSEERCNAPRYLAMIGGADSRKGQVDRPLAMGGKTPSWWNDDVMLSYRFDSRELNDICAIGYNTYHAFWMVIAGSSKHPLVSKRLIHIEDEVLAPFKILQLVAEAKIASTLRYQSIVPFVGVAWTNNTDLQVLYEYMPNGDLGSYLARTDVSSLPWLPTTKDCFVTKLQLAIDVIEALVYTHSFNPPVVHRDLRASNVLLDADWRAKVGGFGSARVESENATMTTRGIGSGRWLAPEILQGSTSYGTSSDMYSFGVLLCELDTHAVPYVAESVGASSESVLLGRVARGELRPCVSACCPLVIRELAESCLSFDAARRPNALQVAHELRVLLQQYYEVNDDSLASAVSCS